MTTTHAAAPAVDFRRSMEALERIQRGETTPQQEVEAMGLSWEYVEGQIAEERAFFEAMGLSYPSWPVRES